MKYLLQAATLMLLLTVVTGCNLFNNNSNDAEGEGEQPVEGEHPGEGERPAEGETSPEGEHPAEGETSPEGELPEFTSADSGAGYRTDQETVDGGPPEVEDEGSEEERALIEPDIIRREGALLYVLNQYRGLSIVDLASETVLSQTPTQGYPRDMYLVGDLAYVLVSAAQDVRLEEDVLEVSYNSKLYAFNIADPTHVLLESSFNIAGDLVDSRQVGNVIYAVCSDYSWYDCCEEEPLRPDMDSKRYGMTWAVSVNIAHPDNIHLVDSVNIPGYGNVIHATNYAIFSVTNDSDCRNSLIRYIDIQNPDGRIVVRGTAEAPGYLADRFKMNASNGVLRAVTNTWLPDRETYVTTFDITNPDEISQLGQTRLESASGETTYATRFDGDLVYIVTYLTIDPLFVVDLADPYHPTVLGELKIPGWSTHIEPRGDRLISLGVDDADGGRRVAVNLFDVSDLENPIRLDHVSFGDHWSWSAAYGDVKAFTVLDEVILVPFSGWNHGYGGYDRLQFVRYDRDTLETRGFVDLQGGALRSFAYDGLYYAVTPEQLAIIDGSDLLNPVVAASVTLAENIVEAAVLPNGWLVEVIQRNDTGDTMVRAINHTENLSGGSLVLPTPSVTAAFPWYNAVAVVTSRYDYEPTYRAYYQVFLVDFGNPEQPRLEAEWTVALAPWWGGWWGYREGVDIAVEPAAPGLKSMYWGGYGAADDAAFLCGDYLALRGYGETFDLVLGDNDAWQGVALVDLAQATETTYVGFGFDDLAAVGNDEGRLYISTRERVGRDRQERALCAYYLQFLNPALLEITAPVNVPGRWLHRIPGTERMLFEDIQYGDSWQTHTLLRSTLREEDRVVLVDSTQLPPGHWTLTADGTEVYYGGERYHTVDEPGYEDGSGADATTSSEHNKWDDYGYRYLVGRLSISRSGTFMEGDVRAISNAWGNLLDVNNNNVFITVGNAAVVRCDFSLSPPEIAHVAPIMGYPYKIRFGPTQAYVPLGYSGLLVMPHADALR